MTKTKLDLFDDIKAEYAENMEYILRIYPRTDPYIFKFPFESRTIIEKIVWTEIRTLGLPMYPEFPACGYFIDFADPVKKIGIEADGKEYHSGPDKKLADMKRDRVLEQNGWTIYRLDSKCILSDTDYEGEFDQFSMTIDGRMGWILKDHYQNNG